MKHTTTITIFLVTLFLASHAIGLAVINTYVDQQATKEQGMLVWKNLPSIAGMPVERPDVQPQYSILYITIAVVIGTLLILAIIRFNVMLLWKLWFFLAIVVCLHIAFGAFLPTNAALLLAIIAGIMKVYRPNIIIHNLTEIFLYGGLAAIFVPILTVVYAYILLLILSLYDMYAVWKSKHMITMAQFQTKSGIFAGLLLPYSLPKKGKGKPVLKKIKTAVLGGGDIGFPLIFSGTVLIAKGLLPAAIVSIAAAASLLVLLLLSQKDRFYPAMPFLTIGCTIGYLLALGVGL
ncbi:hypothetical protein HY489_01970 [Candidatus Woesearchaeota archaeon]|nr:hypothetical protein [Candidatus Woesearchaeota archaeon]